MGLGAGVILFSRLFGEGGRKETCGIVKEGCLISRVRRRLVWAGVGEGGVGLERTDINHLVLIHSARACLSVSDICFTGDLELENV